MKIRKILYNIDYIHILTFKEYYKDIVAPYFIYKGIEYAVDNQNTIEEGIRLVFPNEGFNIFVHKGNLGLLYEDDIAFIKKSNPIINIFFDIYEKIKALKHFSKTTRHRIVISAVDIKNKEEVESKLKENQIINNPFGKLKDFGCIYEFTKNEIDYLFHFGNYSESDIKKFNLSQLNTDYNKDLKENVGFMCQLTLTQDITGDASLSKFKALITEGENIMEQFKDKTQWS